MSNGKLIVIDGLDGSGKTTQTKILYERILKLNKKVKLISFPNYESVSSSLVKMYLNGEISDNVNEINPYAASSFYSSDRYISYIKEWASYYKEGYIIISSRYVQSNLIHQMTKLDKSKWDDFIKWTYDYEYNKLMLPVADLILYLEVDFEISKKLILERSKDKPLDIHEKDYDYMKKCRESFNYIKNLGHVNTILCNDESDIFSVDYINDKIFELVKEVVL